MKTTYCDICGEDVDKRELRLQSPSITDNDVPELSGNVNGKLITSDFDFLGTIVEVRLSGSILKGGDDLCVECLRKIVGVGLKILRNPNYLLAENQEQNLETFKKKLVQELAWSSRS